MTHYLSINTNALAVLLRCPLIQEKLDKHSNPNKEIYTHVTCASDSENMRVVFNAIQDMIIRDSLRKGGLL